jgi:hypothetical protein
MSIESLVAQIEDERFIARLTPTNIPSRLIEFAPNQPEIRLLIAELKRDRAAQLSLLRRMQVLAASQTDYRYENPSDIPLSCYLLALYASDFALAKVASTMLRNTLNSWWIPKVIESLEAYARQRSGTQGREEAPLQTGAEPQHLSEIRSVQGATEHAIRVLAPEPTASSPASSGTAYFRTGDPAVLQSTRRSR